MHDWTLYEATWILAGDYNENTVFDIGDVDALSAAIEIGDTSLDLNGDDLVDDKDLVMWVKEIKRTWFGDANLDGEFNSRDFVQIFQIGEYEDAVDNNSTWAEGDWNADRDFDSADLVVAFRIRNGAVCCCKCRSRAIGCLVSGIAANNTGRCAKTPTTMRHRCECALIPVATVAETVDASAKNVPNRQSVAAPNVALPTLARAWGAGQRR